MVNKKTQERTIGLIGEEKYKWLRNKRIAIIGLGGVGGTALVSLARSGFLNFVLVDSDRVEYSNLNRQILFSNEDVGLWKVDLAASHLGILTDGARVYSSREKITKDNVKKILGNKKIDFLVDAIDDVEGKIALIDYALEKNIPYIVSLGMGNRLDPRKVTIMPLSKTTYDPLAKKLRLECRKNKIDLKKIITVCSTEQPLLKSKNPQSMIMVPSAAGLTIAYHVINHFLDDEKKVGF
ncbi:MAG: tRNA threonylcarbamoyladenosine dehydratase [Erysipelotrichia bacterium]|jgi:tRNA A37 threonylcarbamoyladenosine dehydratase|nr:ThiF family adenylyltransferase [Bacilli bacterium]NLB49852.1 tRNA threonylcarbamoyladenosine dehydratase [Erysipelotrichia bacterium]